MKTGFAIALLLAWPEVLPAQTFADDPALRAAAEAGRTLFLFDRAAWVASDAASAAMDKQPIPLAGWITERTGGDALAVTFFTGKDDARQAVFVAEVDRGKLRRRERLATPRPLTPAQRRQADAVAVAAAEALKRGWRACNDRPFNAIALPPENDAAPTRVYLLTPQVRNDRFPLGGHFRIGVDPARQVTDARAFTKSCIDAPRPPAGAGGKSAMLVANHLLDPQPTEIHVFTSLAAQMPIAVMTGEKRWVVAGPAIRAVPRE